MIIPLDRDKKIIVLKWLQKKAINTDDLKELNEAKDNWFLDLLKRRTETENKK